MEGWYNFRYCPGIFLEGLKKTTRNLRIAYLGAKIKTRDIPNTLLLSE
jgi:hypothetical protein